MKNLYPKYNRSLLCSGGGTRFGIYCGMYAALEDLKVKPDLIIATCGGSIAACIINAYDNNKDRKEYLFSEELFQFICNTELTKFSKLSKIGSLIMQKILDKRLAPYIEDVYNQYLVELPNDLSAVLPSLNVKFSESIPTIIIGSKLLFNIDEVNQNRCQRKLYEKVLFTNNIITKHIPEEILSKTTSNILVQGSVTEKTNTCSDADMLTAARISISDMYYTKPVLFNNAYYAGGAIDLLPIELANSLSQDVIAEYKQRYTATEQALVRAVLGYNANQRLDEVYLQSKANWINTKEITEDLKNQYCKKFINWQKLQIDIRLPISLDQFKSNMEAQWNYGYSKIIKRFKQ